MVQTTTREAEACSDVLRLKIWQLFEHLRLRESGSEEVEDVDDPDPHPAHAGSSPALTGTDGDPIRNICHGAVPRVVAKDGDPRP